MAIGKKVGTLSTIFNLKSDISHYVLMGLFENVGAGSNDTNTTDLQKLFKIKIPEGRNNIMIQSLKDGRLKISLGEFKKYIVKFSEKYKQKFSGTINTKEIFVLDYDTFDIFNSEY